MRLPLIAAPDEDPLPQSMDPTDAQSAVLDALFEQSGNRHMSRTVFCEKLQREAEGLDYAPWPGELGQRIYEHISKPAWQQWLAHQTMLINENRISPFDPKARAFLTGQMEQFLFGGAAETPPGYVPPSAD